MSTIAPTTIQQELIAHLKRQHINTVDALWDETKSYFRNRLINIGGSYASWSNSISVHMKVDETKIRFDVSLEDLKK